MNLEGRSSITASHQPGLCLCCQPLNKWDKTSPSRRVLQQFQVLLNQSDRAADELIRLGMAEYCFDTEARESGKRQTRLCMVNLWTAWHLLEISLGSACSKGIIIKMPPKAII